MPYNFYLILHVVGIMLLFLSLGGLALHAMNGGTKDTNDSRKLLAASHGTALLFILVSGFGLLARINAEGDMSLPPWVYIKLGIWLLFGASIVIPNRRPELAKALWFLLPLLGLAAAYIGVYKPFA